MEGKAMSDLKAQCEDMIQLLEDRPLAERAADLEVFVRQLIAIATNEVHERELLYRRSAVEAEREACAKIADTEMTSDGGNTHVARRIRERSNV
jgi:hypothetical protein